MHKETITVPAPTSTTTPMRATPVEQWVGAKNAIPKVKASGNGGADPCEKVCSCHHNADHSSNCVSTCSSSIRGNQPPEARRPIGWSKHATERAKANANSYPRVGGGFNFWCGRCQKKETWSTQENPQSTQKHRGDATEERHFYGRGWEGAK